MSTRTVRETRRGSYSCYLTLKSYFKILKPVNLKHIEKILKHKDLELELANAKLQQSDLRLAESEERSKAEKKLVNLPKIHNCIMLTYFSRCF